MDERIHGNESLMQQWRFFAMIGLGVSLTPVDLPIVQAAEPNHTVAQIGGSLSVTHEQYCSMPGGWSKIAKRRPHYVVFGETHGTSEAPAFIGSVACALARKGEHVLLAIEHSAVNNSALQAAWRLPVGRFAKALTTTGWAGRKDGVASEAMFGLLISMHAKKEAGFRINVVAFNGARDSAQSAHFAHLPAQGPHEAEQAENIYDAAARGKYDRVLVLVGNLHARKRSVGEGTDSFDPMAMRLARLGRTITLEMRSSGGSMWNCILKPDANVAAGQSIPDDAIDCGNHHAGGDNDLKRSPFMQIGSFPGKAQSRDYDGYVWLGSISGSPPAVR